MAEEKDLIKKRGSYKGRLTTFTTYVNNIEVPELTSVEANELQLRINKMEFVYNQYDETFTLAGLSAGIVEGIIVNPFEVVKVTLQSNKALASQAPSTWTVTKQIVRENGLGLQGINKGLTATIMRHGVANMVAFGFYFSVQGYTREYEDALRQFGQKVAIAFTSGVLCSCVNIPFDVAKSRIQGPQPVPGVVKYRTTTGAILTVYREEGFRALYKGLTPKVMRIGPGAAITLVVYDYVTLFLKKKLEK